MKNPITYDQWAWGRAGAAPVCTNTRFGPAPNGTDADVTLSVPVVACSVDEETQLTLTINMVEDLVSDDWATFEMNFTIGVTIPDDIIDGVDVTSRIVSASTA